MCEVDNAASEKDSRLRRHVVKLQIGPIMLLATHSPPLLFCTLFCALGKVKKPRLISDLPSPGTGRRPQPPDHQCMRTERRWHKHLQLEKRAALFPEIPSVKQSHETFMESHRCLVPWLKRVEQAPQRSGSSWRMRRVTRSEAKITSETTTTGQDQRQYCWSASVSLPHIRCYHVVSKPAADAPPLARQECARCNHSPKLNPLTHHHA